MTNKPGRPRVDPADRTVDLHVRLPAKHYDALCTRATRARRTVPEQARFELLQAVRTFPRQN